MNAGKDLLKMHRITIRKFHQAAAREQKSKREFLEFYINDQPLSDLLDKFYKQKGSILDNWIGVLGSFDNKGSESIKVKRLLGKNISNKDIRRAYPRDMDDSEFQTCLLREREELSDPQIILYCCRACGDYECGGIFVKIDKTVDAFRWTFDHDDRQLIFEFDKYQYFEVLGHYLRQLEKFS